MDTARLKQFVDTFWEDSILPSITDYIRIPNKSPAFDAQWAEHGYMEDAVKLMEAWARDKLTAFPGATLDVVRLPGRTPLILMDIPGDSNDTVLLYGHLDKQPEMKGWFEGYGPWIPLRKDDKLYGRGGADDGYAIYASLCALLALKEQKIERARCVILIEACEESGSYDLPYYVDHLKEKIGEPSLVVCLDSGCGDWDRLWLTTSLRGIAAGTLTVRVLTEGVHSGDASGIVPSSFRLLRQLISRVEDETNGAIRLQDLYVQIPPQRIEQAKAAAAVLGDTVIDRYPFAGSAKPMADEKAELVLNRTWRPQLAVVGADGLPAPMSAGNVLRPMTALKLSVRIPPTADPVACSKALAEVLTLDPPQGAKVTFDGNQSSAGWNAPPLAPWLEAAVQKASQATFGREAALMGEGGTIPFIGMLGEKFPQAQFVITGVLGPHSNAHGPNEFIHLPTGQKVTATAALILADHANRPR